MQASLPKLVVDDIVPYSFKAEKGLCPVCREDFANHQPEDLFLVGEHVNKVREYFAYLDSRQGENRGISPSFSEDPSESLMTEREIVNMIKDLWLQKGPEQANQFHHYLTYGTRIEASKFEWIYLSVAIEQYRIAFDNTVAIFQYRLQEVSRLNNLDLETSASKDAAMDIFHEEIGSIAKDEYADFAAQLHALESRVARNEHMRVMATESAGSSDERGLLAVAKAKEKEAVQGRQRPIEKEIPSKV